MNEQIMPCLTRPEELASLQSEVAPGDVFNQKEIELTGLGETESLTQFKTDWAQVLVVPEAKDYFPRIADWMPIFEAGVVNGLLPFQRVKDPWRFYQHNRDFILSVGSFIVEPEDYKVCLVSPFGSKKIASLIHLPEQPYKILLVEPKRLKNILAKAINRIIPSWVRGGCLLVNKERIPVFSSDLLDDNIFDESLGGDSVFNRRMAIIWGIAHEVVMHQKLEEVMAESDYKTSLAKEFVPSAIVEGLCTMRAPSPPKDLKKMFQGYKGRFPLSIHDLFSVESLFEIDGRPPQYNLARRASIQFIRELFFFLFHHGIRWEVRLDDKEVKSAYSEIYGPRPKWIISQTTEFFRLKDIRRTLEEEKIKKAMDREEVWRIDPFAWVLEAIRRSCREQKGFMLVLEEMLKPFGGREAVENLDKGLKDWQNREKESLVSGASSRGKLQVGS